MTAREPASAPPSLGFGADAAAMIERVRHGMSLHQSGEYAAAAAAYREVLSRYPQHPDVIHYLGMAEYKLGNWSAARELMARSISLDGSKSIVHVNLGRTFVHEGEFASALEHFQRAVRLEPRDWEAQHMLGRAQLATGHPFEAAGALEIALALRPASTAILLDLAHAYGSCLRHPLAESTFRKLLALEPDHVDALGGLASSLRAMSRAEEALACLEKAVALAPREPRWLCELGSLREDLGQFDEAAGIFRSVLEERPRYPVAVAHLLASRKGVEDTSLVEKAKEHLAGVEIARPVRVQLQFALGRHFDTARDYDRAFAHYAAANDLVAEGHRYRPLAMESEVSSIVEAFDRDLFDRMRPFGDSSERPVFVVGMPRSGTTLTEQILASHPEIAGAGELGYFHHKAHVLCLAAGHEEGTACYARILDRKALEDCAAGFLQQLSRVSVDARRVVDKMPMNFMQLGLIALVFPRARIIHCLREPLDTCLSCYFENFHQDQRFATRLESLGHFHRQYERLMDHWRAVLPVPMLDVRYEDTVADTESQARRLVDFCGLPWDDRCLDFHRTERAVSTPSRWQVRQPIYARSVGRWRAYAAHLPDLQAAFPP